MKISVIIPAFNCQNTIERCLNSIINQTYKNLEIIVVNDGSKDNTGEIIEKFVKIDNRIVYIENKNYGVSYSRNNGVRIATGEYITFVDADDWLNENCFEEIAKLENNKFDFIRYNFNSIGGKSFSNELYELKNKSIDLSICRENIMKHFLTNKEKIPNLVFLLVIKKEIAEKIAFDETLFMMEDVDYYLQLFLCCKNCIFIDKKMYNYYVNVDSVTHCPKNFPKIIMGVLNSNNKIINKITNTIYRDMENEIDTNHLRIITNYIEMMFKCSKEDTRNMIKKLLNNQEFVNLLNKAEFVFLPLKNKITVFLLKKKMISCILLFFRIRVLV